jgi:hypothetical protein
MSSTGKLEVCQRIDSQITYTLERLKRNMRDQYRCNNSLSFRAILKLQVLFSVLEDTSHSTYVLPHPDTPTGTRI